MSVLDETRSSLQRVQRFDTSTLPRREVLGAKFAFDESVAPANRLISLFKKLPLDALEEFPEEQLKKIKTQADQTFQQFDEMLNFDETAAEATIRRQSLINQITDSYSRTFSQLYPYISYSVARTVDFARLEEQGRATIQAISDRTKEAEKELENILQKAEAALEEVRAAAAEQGVSQQAEYFKKEADSEKELAEEWNTKTFGWAIALGVYGIASVFLHKWEFLAPTNIAEGLTLTASKLVIFAMLLYMLILSARNFLSHKHNATVNRHRQIGLQTFQVLVKAGTTDATQDIILSHASAAIFSPQETGFTKHSVNSNTNPNGMIDLALRATTRADASS